MHGYRHLPGTAQKKERNLTELGHSKELQCMPIYVLQTLHLMNLNEHVWKLTDLFLTYLLYPKLAGQNIAIHNQNDPSLQAV